MGTNSQRYYSLTDTRSLNHVLLARRADHRVILACGIPHRLMFLELPWSDGGISDSEASLAYPCGCMKTVRDRLR